MGIPVVEGDASDEKTLRRAHIESARGLATVVNTDAENVYVVLTARGIAKDLYIVARASDEKASEKLRRAGASRVITPYTIGGRHMAQTLIQPAAVEFFELASGRGENMEIEIERIPIPPDSPCAGRTLSESSVRCGTDIIIVAVQKKNARMQFNPSSTTVIEPGDTLIAMGNPQSIEKLGRFVGATKAGG
jgi:voltage-gated potassium channel